MTFMADGGIVVKIADGVDAVMEERGILADDVDKVIAQAESTGIKLQSKSSGHFLAKLRLDKVMVYVEYYLEDGTANVYDAYTHRVTLKEEL